MDENIKELCSTVLDYMDELCPVITELHENIKEYDLSGITVLSNITEGLAWIKNAAEAINNSLKIDIQDEINAIITQINEILLAMENNDYLFLADILEFDVIPNMEKIFNVIRDVN